jgi:L-lactate utilization protein LutC
MEGGPEMSARDRILGSIRAGVTGTGDRAKAAAARISRPETGPAPQQSLSQEPARLTRFMARAEAVDATISRVSSIADLPRALARELRGRNLPAAIRTGSDPMFEGLDWGTVEASQGVGRIKEPATLSHAPYALAETGTLVLASGPDNPVTLTYLGETHFVVLREADICGGFEDFWTAWRGSDRDPRTINMVTGPSRSADIGQILQLGAHGPVALHIFLLED